MQSAYEVIKNAIYFNTPDRLPIAWEDTIGLNVRQKGTGNFFKERESYDEWNCKWSRTDVLNMGQVTGHPLYDWSSLKDYKWPDPDDPMLYEGLEADVKLCEGKYVVSHIFMLLFERMHALRGFENALMDLYLEKENIEMLADRIVEYDVRIIENMASRFPGVVHGLSFTDDWGTELSTFISVKQWDEFFKPRYKKIFDAAKKAGWDIWMHSCGKINDIIPSLIDIGVNVLQLLQPNTNGIEETGKRFAGKICFSTIGDIQTTLPFKSPEEIEEEVKKIIKYWGTDEGGLILSHYGFGEPVGIPDENGRAALNAFKKHDRWKK